MAGSTARGGALFLILCAAVAPVRGGGYGEACGKMSDCDERDAQICAIYWKDRSWALNTQTTDPASAKEPSAGTYSGYCVQCQTDCDCGVNQYCGIDKDEPLLIPVGIRSTNDETRNGISREQKLLVELYGKAFAGMPMRSRCYDFEVPGEICNSNSIANNEMYAEPVDQVRLGDGQVEKVLRTPNFWPEAEDSRFCGKINTYAPPFQRIDASGGIVSTIGWSAEPRSEIVSTQQFYNSPAQCPTAVAYRDTSYTCNSCGSGPLACNADGSRPQTQINPLCTQPDGTVLASLPVATAFALREQCALVYDSRLSAPARDAGFSFSSPSVEWQGHCNRGSCQICKETGEPADDRCQATGGIRQRCLNGRWVRVEDLNPTSTQYDINHQTNLATTIGQWMVPLLLTILAILLCCLFCKRDKSDEQDKRDYEEQQPLQELPTRLAERLVEPEQPPPPPQKVYVEPSAATQTMTQGQMLPVPGYEPVPMNVYSSQQRGLQGTTMASF